MATYQEELDRITHGCAPEEGDFNTATLLGDDVPQEEKDALRAQLRRVELGLPEPPEVEEIEWADNDQWVDPEEFEVNDNETGHDDLEVAEPETGQPIQSDSTRLTTRLSDINREIKRLQRRRW